MAALTILRTYALKDPSTLPSSVLFGSTDKFFTIFDAYPKSIFHFLVMPRLSGDHAFPEQNMGSLRALLKGGDEKYKAEAKEVIEGLKSEALNVKKEIEEEMMERYGFKWGVWIGFHAVPSMVHLHLHVLSADLVSERMKNKKHYNSFHPSLGFFLHVDDVLDWFEADSTHYRRMAQLSPKPYEDLLKRDLACWKCESSMKNIPTLKQHLQEEWDKAAAKAKREAATHKRKASGEVAPPKDSGGTSGAGGVAGKRAKTEDIRADGEVD